MDIGLGLVLGLVLGVLFGVILQRGRFCMNSAFQDVFIIKDFTLFKTILVAIMIQIIGFLILATTGLITALYPKPFFYRFRYSRRVDFWRRDGAGGRLCQWNDVSSGRRNGRINGSLGGIYTCYVYE